MAQDPRLTFVGHLDEFRRRLILALVAVAVSAVACYFWSDHLLLLLTAPIRSVIPQVYFFSPAEAFLVRTKVACFVGLLIASPVVLAQLWFFLSPALYGNEKKTVLPLIFVTSLLFVTGAWFCYALVMPAALRFLIGMQTEFLRPMVSMTEYISFLSGMMFAFGCGFNLPVVVVAVVSTGLVSVKTLNKFHRHAVVLIFIAAAVLTPTPDISGQLLLAVPMTLLFELSVAAAFFVEMARKSKAKRFVHD